MEALNLNIGPLAAHEVPSADRVFRVAFGTRNGIAEPSSFDGDAARIRTRCLADHVIALGARVNGILVGTILATVWGEFAWIGPLAIQPEYWSRGIAQRLLTAVIPVLERRNCRHVALFTIGESPKHVALYRKFGFRQGFATIVMQKHVTSSHRLQSGVFSAATEQEGDRYLDFCRTLTSLVYGGLDVSGEISNIRRHSFGETIFLLEDDGVCAFAVCHCGPGTEAGSGTTYVKFAAVRPSPRAADTFERLLTELEALAAARGTARLVAGVNTARADAWKRMVDRGFRPIQQGIAMHRPDEAAYDRSDVYAIDDLR
jgi:GNAT superfamily N-acetyltransferase